MLKVDQSYFKRFFPNGEIVNEIISPGKMYRMYFLKEKSILIITTKTAGNISQFFSLILKYCKSKTFKQYEHKIIDNRNIYIMSYE